MLCIFDISVIYEGPIFAAAIAQPAAVVAMEYLGMHPGYSDIVNKDIPVPVPAQCRRRTPNGDRLHGIGFAEHNQVRPLCTRVQDRLIWC